MASAEFRRWRRSICCAVVVASSEAVTGAGVAFVSRVANAVDWQFVQRPFERFILPAVFALESIQMARDAFSNRWIWIDARIYVGGSNAWLSGLDPWTTFVTNFDGREWQTYHYAALPPVTVLLAPLALLPEQLAWTILAITCVVSAVYVVKRLGLPWYWLMFPPLVEGVLAANPSIPLLALLVSPRLVGHAIAPLIKIYSVLPLIGERRRTALMCSAAALALSIVAWPLWAEYIGQAGFTSARLVQEAGGGFSGFQSPALFVIGLASIGALLALRDRRAAGWLVVPAIWPASQFHYATLAMPVMHPVLALGLAFRIQELPVVAIAVYATWRVLKSVAREDPADVFPGGRSRSGSAARSQAEQVANQAALDST
jgi:hypothetical protein